jgi:hypothetical protein
MNKLQEALITIATELDGNEMYRQGWKANIAMAYIDCENWYIEKYGKKSLNKVDKRLIANQAAEHFIKNLCSGNSGKATTGVTVQRKGKERTPR